MSAIVDQCEVIRAWLNLGEDVYPDPVVTSWIRMAEEQLSKTLRCKDNLQIDTGRLLQQRYLLPTDWRQMEFVRVIGGRPLRYVSKDDFYNPDEPFKSDQINCYTMTGNYIMVGDAIVDVETEVEISYYQDVPPLNENPTWLLTQYPTVYLVTALNMASMYAIEDERGPLWSSESQKLVDQINLEHLMSKASGSRLTQRHRRSFG